MEVETRYKSEISRLKKKYETDIRELEAALDNANRANAEYLKQIKSLQARNKVGDTWVSFFKPLSYWIVIGYKRVSTDIAV